jgi:hypothetical protein
MMEIVLDDPGTFFAWPGEPKGSRNGVVIGLLTPEQQIELDAETVTVENVIIDGELHHDRRVDTPKRERARIQKCVRSWTGLKVGGKELECTDENKVKAFLGNRKLSRFLDGCLTELIVAENAAMEADRKN